MRCFAHAACFIGSLFCTDTILWVKHVLEPATFCQLAHQHVSPDGAWALQGLSRDRARASQLVAAFPSIRLLLAFNSTSCRHELFYMLHGEMLPPLVPHEVLIEAMRRGTLPSAALDDSSEAQFQANGSYLAESGTESGRKRSRQSFGTLSSHSISPPLGSPAVPPFAHLPSTHSAKPRAAAHTQRTASRVLALVKAAVQEEALEPYTPAPALETSAQGVAAENTAVFVKVCDDVFPKDSVACSSSQVAASSAHLVSSHGSTRCTGSTAASDRAAFSGCGLALLGVWAPSSTNPATELVSTPLECVPPSLSVSWLPSSAVPTAAELGPLLQLTVAPPTRTRARSWQLCFPPNKEETAMWFEPAAPVLAWRSSPLQGTVLGAQAAPSQGNPAVALALQQSYAAVDVSSVTKMDPHSRASIPFFPAAGALPLLLEEGGAAPWDSPAGRQHAQRNSATAWVLPDVLVQSESVSGGGESCHVLRGGAVVSSVAGVASEGRSLLDPRHVLPAAAAQLAQMASLALPTVRRAYVYACIHTVVGAILRSGLHGLTHLQLQAERNGDTAGEASVGMTVDPAVRLSSDVVLSLVVGCVLRAALAAREGAGALAVTVRGVQQAPVPSNALLQARLGQALPANSDKQGAEWHCSLQLQLQPPPSPPSAHPAAAAACLSHDMMLDCIQQLMTGICNPCAGDEAFARSFSAAALVLVSHSSDPRARAAAWAAREWGGECMRAVHLHVGGEHCFMAEQRGSMAMAALPVFPMWAANARECLSCLARGVVAPLPPFMGGTAEAQDCTIVPEAMALPLAVASMGPVEALLPGDSAAAAMLQLQVSHCAQQLDWPVLQSELQGELGAYTCARIAVAAGQPSTARMLATGAAGVAARPKGVRRGLSLAAALLGHQPDPADWGTSSHDTAQLGIGLHDSGLIRPPQTGDWHGELHIQGTGTPAGPGGESGAAGHSLLLEHRDSVGDVPTLLVSASNRASSAQEDDLSGENKRTLVQAALMASGFFPDDRRWEQIAEMLDCSEPPLLAQHPIFSAGTDHARMEALQGIVARRAMRALVSPFGRGALTLGLVALSPEHLLPVQRVTLASRVPPNGTLQNVDMAQLGQNPKAILATGAFHNGVATGLQAATQVMSETGGATALRAWVMAHRTASMTPASAGVLLGLGLRGLFTHLRVPDVYQLLRDGNDSSSISCLLGLAASHCGTGERAASKAMTLLLPRSLPAAAADFDIHATVQAAAVSSLGLLYAGTGQRSVAEFALHEITSCPCPPASVDSIASHKDHNELYALAAGWALGAVELPRLTSGKAEPSVGAPRSLPSLSRLVRGLAPLGFVPPPVDSIYESSGGLPVPKVYHEPLHVNPAVVAPAAITAVALMYQRSGDENALRAVQLPSSLGALDALAPDSVLLRAAAASLIDWESVVPSAIWLQSQVPKVVLTCVKEMTQQAAAGGASSDLMVQLAALMAGSAAPAAGCDVNTPASSEQHSGAFTPTEKTDPYFAANEALHEQAANLPVFPFHSLAQVDTQAVSQIFLCSMSGAAWAMGMRFAGTNNAFAAQAILNVLQLLVAVATCSNASTFTTAMHSVGGVQQKSSVTEALELSTSLANIFAVDMSTVRMCLCSALCSLGMVCSGTGDANALRAMLAVQTHVADEGSLKPDLDMALSMSMGWLGMSAGRGSFERTPLAVACLWLSSFPHWPGSLPDNSQHMQPWRHLYALAHSNCSLAVQVPAVTPLRCSVQLKLKPHAAFELGLPLGEDLHISAPGRLPERDLITNLGIPAQHGVIDAMQPCHWHVGHLLRSSRKGKHALFESSAGGYCLALDHTSLEHSWRPTRITEAIRQTLAGSFEAFRNARWASLLCSQHPVSGSPQLQQAIQMTRDVLVCSMANLNFQEVAAAVPFVVGAASEQASARAAMGFRRLECSLSPSFALQLNIVRAEASPTAEEEVILDTWDGVAALCKRIQHLRGTVRATQAANEVLLTLAAAATLFEA